MKNIQSGSNSMFKETQYAKIALGIGIILMLGLPWLLTREIGIISFLNTGPIGDTIGGITAPISGLLGAYLVFLALKAQVSANKIQSDSIQKQFDEIIKKDNIGYIERTIPKIDSYWNSLISDNTLEKEINPQSVHFNIWMKNNNQKIKVSIIQTFVFLDFIIRKSKIDKDDPIFKQLIHEFYVSFEALHITLLRKIHTNLNWESRSANLDEFKPIINYIIKDLELIRESIIINII